MNKPNPLCLRAVDFVSVSDEERGDSADGRTLEGYAAVFNVPTEINSWEGKFTEQIARGAFRKSLGERMPVLQFDHGHDARTGTVPIGKFEDLREDRQGLKVVARLFDNPVVEPIRQAIEGGAISGMSFRFKVVRDEWHDSDGVRVKGEELGKLLWDPGKRGPLKRTIREVQLFEAGPVVFPAYAETSVGVRSLTDDERLALSEEYVRTSSIESESAATISDGDESSAGPEPEERSEAESVEGEPEGDRRDTVDGDSADESREGEPTIEGSAEDADRSKVTSSGLTSDVRRRKLFLMSIQKPEGE